MEDQPNLLYHGFEHSEDLTRKPRQRESRTTQAPVKTIVYGEDCHVKPKIRSSIFNSSSEKKLSVIPEPLFLARGILTSNFPGTSENYSKSETSVTNHSFRSIVLLKKMIEE
jgi:hypothetical protein